LCILFIVYCGYSENISICDDQEEWIQDNYLNPFSFVQEKLDERIEERES